MNLEQNKSEHYFTALRNTDYSATFDKAEQWLYQTNIQLNNQRKERKLRKMKNYFLANKMRLVYPVIALAILIAACSMPVTQTENVGSMLSWTVDKTNTQAQEQIKNLSWLKGAQLNINENTNNGKTEILYSALLNGSTESQIEGYKKDLEKIKDITSIKVYPMQENVKRPLYSAALYKFFRVNINGTGMSDEQLQQEIQKQFKEQGIDMNVSVKTNDEGRREVRMDLSGNNSKDPKNIELNIKEGNGDEKSGEEKLKIVTKNPFDANKFKGKTDEEIRKMIKEDLNNPDIKDDEIKIIREGDDVKVKVEVERKK